MKNTLQLKKQLRARRKKQSKRQTLSLEQLEPKQLLSATSDDVATPVSTDSQVEFVPNLNIYFADWNHNIILGDPYSTISSSGVQSTGPSNNSNTYLYFGQQVDQSVKGSYVVIDRVNGAVEGIPPGTAKVASVSTVKNQSGQYWIVLDKVATTDSKPWSVDVKFCKPFQAGLVDASKAPFDPRNGQQGGNKITSWTASQDKKPVRASNEFTIDTIEEYYTYLSNGEVAEVSDKLVACFYQSNTSNDPKITPAGISTLYPGHQIENAWVGSSANLYDLLILNQRFPRLLGPGGLPPTASARGGNGSLYGIGAPGDTDSSTLQPTPTFSGLVSDKALQGLTRIVGFAFGGGDGTFPNPVAATAGNIPALAVFNHEDGIFTPASAKAGSTDHVYSLPDFVPTLHAFFQQTNDGRPLLLGSDSGRVRPLPHAVLEKLESWYAEGITQPKDPLKIFSEISGITHLGEIWSKYAPAYPGAPYDVYQYPVASPSIPIALQQTGANYTVYKEACEVVRGYYLDWKNNNPPAQNGGGTPYTNEQAIEMFFNGFVGHRLVQLDAIDPVLDPVIYDSAINDLAVGLRALMAMSYDASPLWSSYGVGYSNAANPMVGKTYDEIAATSNPIEILSGQEFQLQNVQLPSNYLNVTGQNPVQTGPIGGQNNYPSGGWFDLQEPALPLNGINYISNIPDNDFTTNYTIGSTKTSVIFPSDSLSSNTLSAAGLSGAGDLFTRDSIARDNLVGESTLQTFKELSGLTYHEDILEEGFSFATHISLAGGVDLVTGSQFSDVIVGPGHGVDDLPNKEFHGRLNVDAGAGDDIVAPGRGGSLVILGEGADKVVFGHSDLFGETNFLDFNFEQGDRLFIDHQMSATIDPENPGSLLLKNAKGDKKVLRLTGASDSVWREESILTATYSSINTNTPGLFSYIELFNFYPDSTFNPLTYKNTSYPTGASGVNLVIAKNSKTLPSQFAVSIGNETQTTTTQNDTRYVFLGTNADGTKTPFYNEIFNSFSEGSAPLNFSITPLDTDTSDQYQVFLTRDYQQSPTLFSNNIKSSLLDSDLQTKWRSLKQANGTYTIGYFGGLANYIVDKGLTASLANPTSESTVQIILDKNFTAEIGASTYNLSSRIALYPNATFSNRQDAELFITNNNLNFIGQSNYPTGLPGGAHSEDVRLLSVLSNAQFTVNGNYALDGSVIIEKYPNAENFLPQNDPYYFINSDLLTISTSYEVDIPVKSDKYSIDVAGISLKHPAHRGYGSMLFQDFGNLIYVEKDPGDDLNFSYVQALNHDNPAEQNNSAVIFKKSPVKIYDFKQYGGWVDRADGPTMGGYYSNMQYSFIHTNDDSLKVQAPYTTFKNNTVLQGNAGNPIAYGYGFVNTGVGGSVVQDTYVHRITHVHNGTNPYGVVAMRVQPSPQYNFQNFIGVTVNDVYIPKLSGSQNINSLNYINTLEIGSPIRTFGINPYPLSGGIIDFTVGDITIENIRANPSWIKTSDARWGAQTPPNTTPIKYSETKPGVYELPDGNTLLYLYDNNLQKTSRKVLVSQEPLPGGVIQLWSNEKSTIQRPKLRRSSKILVHRTGELEGKMGPSPVVLAYSTLADATLQGTRGSGRSNTFVVSKVASGYVEKKRSDGSWVDVSTPPKTSNPRTLLQLLRNRMITPSDEIRWVPGTANEGKASAEAFSLYGWDGVSASVEASEIEVGVE